MKTTMRTLARGEKGQALILAIILLLVGGLIAAPLLAHMGTGILTGEVYDTRTAELYAADAGVEDAVWKIQHQDQVPEVKGLTKCYDSTNYTMTNVNNRSVAVNLTLVNNLTSTYRVLSTATGDGSGTRIDAYVTGVGDDYSGILDHVITSQGPISYSPGQNITPSQGPNGPAASYNGSWPDTAKEVEKFKEFYLWDVDVNRDKYTLDTLSVNGNVVRGPLYREGQLTIESLSNGSQLTLNGTFYITGKAVIKPTNNDLTINLNRNTLFVASCYGVVGCPQDPNGNNGPALDVGGKCNIVGPGAIVVVGSIDFKPNIEVADPNKPVFLMSVLGETNLQPQNNGYFYGAIAGSVRVNLQPNQTVQYPVGGFAQYDLNFPTGIHKLIYTIASWEVTPL